MNQQQQQPSVEFDVEFYRNQHNRAIRRVRKRLDRFLESPSEENIHDLRIAVRKARASLSLVPGSASRGRKKYMKKAKKLFKASSGLRDVDMIRSKLEGYHLGSELSKQAKKERAKGLRSTESKALALRGFRQPKLGGRVPLDQRKLAVDLQRRQDRLLTKIHESFETAMSDEGRPEVLHAMRTDFKKLRYALELIPPDPSTKKLGEQLHEWQDRLGDIHDHDMFLDYMRKQEPSEDLQQVIASESKKRTDKFHEFVESYRNVQLPEASVQTAVVAVAATPRRTDHR